MSLLDAGCMTVVLHGSVFAFAVGLSIALQGDAAHRFQHAGAADSSGTAWLLTLVIGFLEEFPRASSCMRQLFLGGLSAAALAGITWLAISFAGR